MVAISPDILDRYCMTLTLLSAFEGLLTNSNLYELHVVHHAQEYIF